MNYNKLKAALNEWGKVVQDRNKEIIAEASNDKGTLFLDAGGSAELFILENQNDGITRFRGKFQESGRPNKNKREYPQDVLDENMKRLKETIGSRGLVGELDHPCLTDVNFDVLTTYGWESFKNIRKNDVVYSRVNGEMVESKVEAIIDAPYDGTAYKVKGRSIDCTFTAPHKFMLCKRSDHRTKAHEEFYVSLDDIHKNRKQYSHDYIPKTASWEGEWTTQIRIPGIVNSQQPGMTEDLIINADKFVTFLGIYLAEGFIKKKTNRIAICQKNEYGKRLIREILSNFHEDLVWKEYVDGFYINDARLYNYLIPLGNCYTKYIPNEIKALSPNLLNKLITAFTVGDGRIQKSDGVGERANNLKETASFHDLLQDQGTYSRVNLFSVSQRLIDDLHECVIKTGGCANLSVIESDEDYQFAGRTIKCSNKQPLYHLHLSRSTGIHMDTRFLQTIETHHTGSIYCLKTTHGNFYMRYRGKSFWTGNCDSIIHFEKASHIITDLWWEGNVLMGEGEILPTPHGKILESLIKSGVRVGISSRGVGNGQVRPKDGVLVIGESYKLITFDAVADPSTFSAYQKIVSNDTKKESIKSNPIIKEIEPERVDSVSKNEATGINTNNEKLLVAYAGQLISSHIKKLKQEIF